MKEGKIIIAAAFAGLWLLTGASGIQIHVLYNDHYAVATFECAGLYWKIAESGTCSVRYKKNSETDWNTGLDLVYDPREGEYRGSVVGLSPGTGYQQPPDQPFRPVPRNRYRSAGNKP